MKWAVAMQRRPDNPGRRGPRTEARPAAECRPAHDGAAVGGGRGRDRRRPRVGAWTGTKLAFEFLVLTAARSGEVRLATWDEIDVRAGVWVVPGSRMKAKRDQRVCR